MMLMLEKWSSDFIAHEPVFELAMLLDEAPLFQYSATNSGEPWRRDSFLAEASRSADLHGYAWLYVVFLTDSPELWGSRKVRLGADGSVMRAETTVSGVRTGRLVSLKCEVVARHIFRNLRGVDSKRPYKILLEAHLASTTEVEGRMNFRLPEKDPLLGYADWVPNEVRDMTRFSQYPVAANPELGCLFTWLDHENHSEKWFMCDVENFLCYRFYLTEFQRRPFVKVVMEQLGFVEGSNMQTFEEVCSSHINNIANSMKALSEIDASICFSRHPPNRESRAETSEGQGSRLLDREGGK